MATPMCFYSSLIKTKSKDTIIFVIIKDFMRPQKEVSCSFVGISDVVICMMA